MALAVLCSCGQKDFPNYDPVEEIRMEREQGNYRAKFKNLNKKWAGQVRGYSILWLRGNQFYARVSIKTRMPGVLHLQYIHEGARCPDSRDDINQDGILDREEVLLATGKILVPLDGDLTIQRGGAEDFPIANEEGSFVYDKATSFRYLMRDLRQKDYDFHDDYVRLSRNGELSLHERTIIIYGTAESPAMPIACAEIYEDFDAGE